MTRGKRIVSYILAVVISICMIAVILLGCINSNILNKDNMRKSFMKSDYYYNLYAIIQESTQDEVRPSGFEESVLDDVFTEDKLKEDVDDLINCVYNNRKVEISTESIKDKLDENIDNEIQKNNYRLNGETQLSINEFEDSIINTYKNHISYSEDVIGKISESIQRIGNMVKVVTIILYIVIAILLVVLFILNKSAIGISLIISGIFFILVNAYSGTTVAVNNILLFNWAFSKTIIYVLNEMLHNLFTKGIILLILGVVSVVVAEYIKAKKVIEYKN